MAAPADTEERRLDDEAQIEALRQYALDHATVGQTKLVWRRRHNGLARQASVGASPRTLSAGIWHFGRNNPLGQHPWSRFVTRRARLP
jgi:hypothetical protein